MSWPKSYDLQSTLLRPWPSIHHPLQWLKQQGLPSELKHCPNQPLHALQVQLCFHWKSLFITLKGVKAQRYGGTKRGERVERRGMKHRNSRLLYLYDLHESSHISVNIFRRRSLCCSCCTSSNKMNNVWLVGCVNAVLLLPGIPWRELVKCYTMHTL